MEIVLKSFLNLIFLLAILAKEYWIRLNFIRLIYDSSLRSIHLVKMCPLFDGSPLAFCERYQIFLEGCLYLHKRVTNFGYYSEKLTNLTDVTMYILQFEYKKVLWIYFLFVFLVPFLKPIIDVHWERSEWIKVVIGMNDTSYNINLCLFKLQ